jgi:Na+/H+ antiporter NhaD/arsenite permease-like protein
MTPIGNPQNVLVALQSGMRSPFVEFITRLAVPTLVSLVVLALVIERLYRLPRTKIAIQHLKELGVGAGDLNAWLTLATAATLAGNITVFGAASNVIVLEVLESRYGVSIPYFRFTKVGLLVTAIVLPIYLPFLLLKF